ncbi:tetratricopeptide repeat protein [Clostridium sp. LCP25S3_F10]|uniref:tetratricopeptide repeat protein n=1 Tax=Clostridium sp. LCP25S3_F10 TaxID=3438750 RepID=UPI003F938831
MFKIYLTNTIFSLLIFLFIKLKTKEEFFIGFIIMICLPFFGSIFYIINIYYRKKITSKFNNSELEKDNYSKSYNLKSKPFYLSKNMEVIPIEDALVLNDEKIKKSLIINVLKSDSYKYLDFLKEAIRDEDTETSHYAATAVTEVKRKLTLAIQEFKEKYQKNKTDLTIIKAYADALKKYNDSGLLDKNAYQKNLSTYKELLQKIIEMEAADEYLYEEIINCYIILKDFERAIEYCNQYFENFKKSEKPYLLIMKIYFINKNRTKFNKVLRKLRESNIILNRDSLNLIKFWLEGEI